MLIPIIKESERLFEEKFKGLHNVKSWSYETCDCEAPDNMCSVQVKSHLASSQLALLEGLKMEWQAKITHEHGDTEEDYDIQEAKNYLIETFVESLEESITYLKTKI